MKIAQERDVHLDRVRLFKGGAILKNDDVLSGEDEVLLLNLTVKDPDRTVKVKELNGETVFEFDLEEDENGNVGQNLTLPVIG